MLRHYNLLLTVGVLGVTVFSIQLAILFLLLFSKKANFKYATVCKASLRLACRGAEEQPKPQHERAEKTRGDGGDQEKKRLRSLTVFLLSPALRQHSHYFSITRRLSFAPHYLNAYIRLYFS